MVSGKTEQELIALYGGIAMDKQFDLGEMIGKNSWAVDVPLGQISFGQDMVYAMQMIGSLSHQDDSWMWAWANTASNLPESLLVHATQLRQVGEERGIDLLRLPQFKSSKDDLHLIGMIASGMYDTSGYYLADYGQGTLLVTIKDERLDQARKEEDQRIVTVIPKLIGMFDMDHRLALTSYLRWKGYAVNDDGRILRALRDQHIVTAEFDTQSRMIALNLT